MVRFRSWATGLIAVGMGGLSLGWVGCSSAPKTTTQPIHKILAHSIHFRRPPSPSAIDQAGPGGIDYQSNPLPGKNFDCLPLTHLMPQLDWKEIHACLATGAVVVDTLWYQLKRETQPYLELVIPVDTPPPACVQKHLAQIPVPREVFFVSTDTGQPACYSTRLDLEADKFFDTQMPTGGYAMGVFLPLRYPPQNPDEAQRLVLSWAITPLWNHEFRQFDGVVFPDALCKRCMGEKALSPPAHTQILSAWPPQ